jgi:acyl-CoA thioester hydrolase
MDLLEERVVREWTDYNGHLNVAYYHMAFDRATDRLLEDLGLGEETARRGEGSMFALEDHLTYQRELREGDPFRITCQLLDFDEKRVHYFLRMFHAEEGVLVATCEHLSIFVDMRTRRSASFPEPVRDRLQTLYATHRSLPVPEEVGRPMGLRRK